MAKIARLLAIALTLAVYGWILWHGQTPPLFASFRTTPIPLPDVASEPFCTVEYLAPRRPGAMMHVGSLCETAEGGLAACWYEGSREGATDVAICWTRKGPGRGSLWQSPETLVDRPQAMRELGRYVRKLGNAVLFGDQDKRLWLTFVSIPLGGWSGSSLNVKLSNDQGRSWTAARRLYLGPFFNLSELVRDKPLELAPRGLALPIYHEFLGKFPEILWLQAEADSLGAYAKTRIAGGRCFIQPSLIARDAAQALAFLRTCCPPPLIGLAATHDGGRTWSPPVSIGLPNPDAAVSALRLADQRVLMAYNGHPTRRDNLQLAVGSPDAQTWEHVVTVAGGDPAAEFSYPYLLQTSDGTIHLLYTWRRRALAHMAFNRAWLEARLEGQP